MGVRDITVVPLKKLHDFFYRKMKARLTRVLEAQNTELKI